MYTDLVIEEMNEYESSQQLAYLDKLISRKLQSLHETLITPDKNFICCNFEEYVSEAKLVIKILNGIKKKKGEENDYD